MRLFLMSKFFLFFFYSHTRLNFHNPANAHDEPAAYT